LHPHAAGAHDLPSATARAVVALHAVHVARLAELRAVTRTSRVRRRRETVPAKRSHHARATARRAGRALAARSVALLAVHRAVRAQVHFHGHVARARAAARAVDRDDLEAAASARRAIAALEFGVVAVRAHQPLVHAGIARVRLDPRARTARGIRAG